MIRNTHWTLALIQIFHTICRWQLQNIMTGSLTTSELSAQFDLSCSVSSDDPIRTLTKIFHTIRRKKKPISSVGCQCEACMPGFKPNHGL